MVDDPPSRRDSHCQRGHKNPAYTGYSMHLNSVELAFLERLSLNAWNSPPVFDHRLLDRVVDAGYVAKQPAALDAAHYEITDSGRAAVIAVTN